MGGGSCPNHMKKGHLHPFLAETDPCGFLSNPHAVPNNHTPIGSSAAIGVTGACGGDALRSCFAIITSVRLIAVSARDR